MRKTWFLTPFLVVVIALFLVPGAEAGSEDGLNDASAPLGSRGSNDGEAVAVAPPGPPTAPRPTDSSCASGGACLWHRVAYKGDMRRLPGTIANDGWLKFSSGFKFSSAKNRFNDRKVLLADAFAITKCLDPGEEKSELRYLSDRFNVGRQGSRC